jgi:hypothetical protein
MRIVVTRLDDKRYGSVIKRDGVSFRLGGPGFMKTLPHDLAHYVVESTLGLPHGFWGCIADGAVPAGMTWISGRQKPRAKEMAKTILKARKSELSEAEVLVDTFEGGISQGIADDWPAMRASLKDRLGTRSATADSIGPEDVANVRCAWSELQSRWQALQPGQSLTLDWPRGSPHRKSGKTKRQPSRR